MNLPAVSTRKQIPLSVAKFFNSEESNAPANKLASAVLPFALASSLVFPAFAADAASIFTNDYSDPLHPQCRRHIEVNADGKSFHYSGTAVGSEEDPVLRGCSSKEIKEFGIRRGAFDGIILEGNKISVGDGIHEGVWEPSGTATTNLGYEDVDGIRWKDGNKWIVKEKSTATQVGEIITFAYIGFSLLAGVKGVYNMYEKKMAESLD